MGSDKVFPNLVVASRGGIASDGLARRRRIDRAAALQRCSMRCRQFAAPVSTRPEFWSRPAMITTYCLYVFTILILAGVLLTPRSYRGADWVTSSGRLPS